MVDGNRVHFNFSGVTSVRKGTLADHRESRSVYRKNSTGHLCRSKFPVNTKIGTIGKTIFGIGEWESAKVVIEQLNIRLAKNALVKEVFSEMDASKPVVNIFTNMIGVLN